MRKSESIAELAKAMSKFQGEVKQPVKDGTNPHFRSSYVTLQGTVEAITKAAAPNGLSFMQFPINEDNKVGVYTLIMHSSGEWIESDPVYATPMKNDAQAVGSVITYAKRYSLSAAFGIASDLDDDGESAMIRPSQQNQQQPSSYQQQAPKNAGNGISEPQLKLIKTKLSIAGDRDNEKMKEVYENMLSNLGISAGTNTKDLNKSQASKVIEYLNNITS